MGKTTKSGRNRRRLMGAIMSTTLFLSGGGADSLSAAVMGMEEEFLFADLGDMPGILTRMKRDNLPVSVTTITAEDIRATPAKNLLDLLEVYVPGAQWMTHSENAHPAIRGIVSNRNDKFLLLVNGHPMNQKTHSGAMAEIYNWDISDVEKVEVIRGPGSVTYGPGAIMGVINITLKDADTHPGLRFGSAYLPAYASRGGYAGYGLRRPSFSLYAYTSVVKTDGAPAKRVRPANGTVSLVPNSQEYWGDFSGQPQKKFYIESNFLQNWRIWARYTTVGNTLQSNKERLAGAGDLINYKEIRDRHATARLESKHDGDTLSWRNALAWDSKEHIRRQTFGVAARDDIRNMMQMFSEDTIFGQSVLNWTPSSIVSMAFGGEYAYDVVGPAWGGGGEKFRAGDNREIHSDPGSPGIGNNAAQGQVAAGSAVFAGNGWGAASWAYLGESNFTFSPRFSALLSGRVDRHQYSHHLYSPRLAIISDQDDAGLFKLILQQSVRTQSLSQLYLAHRRGVVPGPERLKGLELIYVPALKGEVSSQVSAFLNKINLLGWNNSLFNTSPVGELTLAGIELEGKRTGGRTVLGANYSFVKQIRFKADPASPFTGVSYSDYARTTGTLALKSYGNDINQWSNHALKAFSNVKVGDRIRWHSNLLVFSEKRGSLDGLQSVLEASATNQANKDLASRTVREARNDWDVYGVDARFSTSISYEQGPVTLTLFSQNLLFWGRNKRYEYDAGLIAAPQMGHMLFNEEPRTVGFKVDVRL